MKTPGQITIELLSDTCFGAGYGTGSIVDTEIDHDELGLPRLSGRAIHGLLRDTWLSMKHHFPQLQKNADRILGIEGDLDETAILAISDARAPGDVIDWVRYAQEREGSKVTRELLLDSITSIRRQTSVDRNTGAALEGSLRSTRVLLRDFRLECRLTWLEEPTREDVTLLAMCLLGTRHAGLNRTRGLGHIRLTLDGNYEYTRELVAGGDQA